MIDCIVPDAGIHNNHLHIIYFQEARLFGATTLLRSVLLWPFLAFPILLLVHFGVDLFGVNFKKIIFSFSNFSIFF